MSTPEDERERHAAAASVTHEQPPWDELDPGIHATVETLWLAGFNPIDSGDGVSKQADQDYECIALDIAHVFMACRPEQLVSEARRLKTLTSSWRVTEPCAEHVQATYSPDTGLAMVLLFGKVVA